MLEAVYLTIYKYAAEVRGCPTARTWPEEHAFSNQLAFTANECHSHRAYSSVGLNSLNVDIQFQLSKRKKPKAVPSENWRLGPHPSTKEFARTQLAASHYHEVTHRSSAQIEQAFMRVASTLLQYT